MTVFGKVFVLVLFLIKTVLATDYQFRANLQTTHTNNANLDNTNQIADRYRTLMASIQAKKNNFTTKLKLKKETYNITKDNSNYLINANIDYQSSKQNRYGLELFKLSYIRTPSINTDSTQDNNGAKLYGNFAKNFQRNLSGYLGLSGVYKKYTQIENRTDKTWGLSLGLDFDKNEKLYLNTDLSFRANLSSESYYSYFQYAPSIYLTYLLTEEWEINGDISYARNQYFSRYVGQSRFNNTEIQTLISSNISTRYTFEKMFSIEVKYYTGTNHSNNADAEYQVDEFSINLGFKY